LDQTKIIFTRKDTTRKTGGLNVYAYFGGQRLNHVRAFARHSPLGATHPVSGEKKEVIV